MILSLEQQVTSLEISKRLKELGANQESLFRWEVGNTISRISFNDSSTIVKLEKEIKEIYASYTLTELCILILENAHCDEPISPNHLFPVDDLALLLIEILEKKYVKERQQ